MERDGRLIASQPDGQTEYRDGVNTTQSMHTSLTDFSFLKQHEMVLLLWGRKKDVCVWEGGGEVNKWGRGSRK